ncbi:hypothetical protein HPB50_006018 [Hyalomma asiaticum]|uniref:Uncharacterized protein n=1 Tax=Hyalomma asiaticum TaxID=266040 RepID=A0ACB7SRZ2_HYAAI|nr:hypothetical protein HPB50_006018 [Hyalomma asiaticum]
MPALEKGVLAIHAYARLPCGKLGYHFPTNLAVIAVSCAVAGLLPLKSIGGLVFTRVGGLGCAAYILLLAVQSRNPVLVCTVTGSALRVRAGGLFVPLTTFRQVLLCSGYRGAAGFVIVFLQSKLSVFVIGLLVVALSAVAVAGGAFCPDMTCMAVTVGGLYGLGFGASLTSFAIYTMIYFEKYMATATSLKYAAWSASGLVGPSIVSLLANYYGLRGTLLLIGAIMLNGLPLIMLIKRPRPMKLWCSSSHSKPRQSSSSPSSEQHTMKEDQSAVEHPSPHSTVASAVAPSSLPKGIDRLGLTARGVAELFRTSEFFALLFVYAVFDWTGTLHSTTSVDYGRDKGASLETAKYVLTCNAFGQIVGRLALSFASDKIPHSHCPLAAACLVASCLSFVGCSLVSSFTSFMALNGLLGVSQGYVTSIRSVVITQYLSVQRLPAFFAFLGVFLIPIALTGPSILGFFRDTLGSYDNIYLVFGAANLLAALVLFVLSCRDGARRSTWELKPCLTPSSNGLPLPSS